MANGTTYKRPSLDYSLGSSFMTEYGKALKPTWQRSGSMVAGVTDVITSGIKDAFRSKEIGKALTDAQVGKWEDATTREQWNTKEQYDAFIELEKAGKEAYLEAVRTGDTQEQARLLAEQAERKAGLVGWGESATLAIENDSGVGWASSPRVHSPSDRFMVAEVVGNRTVTYRMQDGQMQIGVDYSELYNPKTGDPADDAAIKAQIGIPDPLPDGMTEEQWLAENGFELKDGKLTRYVTKGEFDKIVTGAIAPTVLAENLARQLDGFQKSGATEGSDFRYDDIKLGFSQKVTKGNLKTLMHEPVIGTKSWADKYFTEDKQKEIWKELYPDPSGTNPVEFGDADGDGEATPEELAGVKEYMLNALEEDKNLQIIKDELGDWFAIEAQLRYNAGKQGEVEDLLSHDHKVRTGTKIPTVGALGGNQSSGGVQGATGR